MKLRPGFDGALRAHLVHQPSPILIITYADGAELEGILEDIAIQLGVSARFRCHSQLETALASPDEVAALVVKMAEQEETIDRLDAIRDRLRDRRAPLILLVPRGGAAMRRLRTADYLQSWVRGRILDREVKDAVNLDAAREDFVATTGLTPERWLERWRAGDLPDDPENNQLATESLFLVQGAE